jgi:Fur family ferric uptake transcriptional regulator
MGTKSSTRAAPRNFHGAHKNGKGRGKSVPTPTELKATLHEAGLRSTAPRLAVLEYLHRAGAPASHGELHERLSTSGFDRATLYRNLIDLADAGLVTRTDLGDHVWRFELRREGGGHTDDHPHFVCTVCGNVACLHGVAIRISSAKGAPRAVERKNVQVQLSGRCDSCTN